MATINGTAGRDHLNGTAAGDTINGLGGDDSIGGNQGSDLIHGGDGNDRITGHGGNDILHGDDGDDYIDGGVLGSSQNGYDQYYGGGGNDFLNAETSATYLIDGGAGIDGCRVDFSGSTTAVNINAAAAASDAGQSLGANRIVRRVEDMTVIFGSGDDTFRDRAAGGDDYVAVGDGADKVYVSAGRDVLISDAGAVGEDQLFIDYSAAASGLRSELDSYGDGFAFRIWEGSSRDAAPRSTDTIGFDRIHVTGSNFADRIVGSDADDRIMGGGGNDVLTAQLGADLLDGGAGSDTLSFAFSTFVLYPPIGVDYPPSILTGATIDLAVTTAQALPRYDTFFDGIKALGSVTLKSVENIAGTRLDDLFRGTAGVNRLDGQQGDDYLSGRDGNDILFGRAGDDVIEGGAGNDRLDGGAGIDTAFYGSALAAVRITLAGASQQATGGGGSDSLVGFENATGGAGDDRLEGSELANRLDGGAGGDVLIGRDGDDIYLVDDGRDQAIESSATGGTDTVLSSVSFVLGARIEKLVLTGTASLDGTGNAAANQITGNRADNIIWAEAGADVLSGAGGADTLFGGAGDDRLEGGSGADSFCFDAALSSRANVDEIADFRRADDTIMLDRDVFSAIAEGTLAEPAFHAGTAAAAADDRIVYDEATGRIFYDTDGAGGAAAILFARVEAGTTLTHADFVGYI